MGQQNKENKETYRKVMANVRGTNAPEDQIYEPHTTQPVKRYMAKKAEEDAELEAYLAAMPTDWRTVG